MSLPKVSVILPTYQREELLCQTLNDLLKLDYPDYEVIVVDQSSDHQLDTISYIESIKDRIVYIKREKPSLILALNAALEIASGEIFIFVDDDIQITDADFIRKHVSNYEDSSIGGVAGKVLDVENPVECDFDERTLDPVWGFFFTVWNHNFPHDSYMAPGANMSFRAGVIKKIGGFDLAYAKRPARFENDICLCVIQLGYRVRYDPSVMVLHHYNSPGGCENRTLNMTYSHESKSHTWYRDLFESHVYFSLKHLPAGSWPKLWWLLYRKYVMNGAYLKNGLYFIMRRHWVFFAGVLSGLHVYKTKSKSKVIADE